jgi:hypothetical protein
VEAVLGVTERQGRKEGMRREWWDQLKTYIETSVIVETVRRLLLTAGLRVQFSMTSLEICGARSGTGAGLAPSSLGCPMLLVHQNNFCFDNIYECFV